MGALACQKDSYLKTLTTTVLSCIPVERPNGNGKNKGKDAIKDKGKDKCPTTVASAGDLGCLYQVELEDTVLFPEGGGQPSDTGFIRVVHKGTADEADKIPVVDVQRKDLRAVHITSMPVPTDVRVEVVLDWRRRLDHMQQHTGQHLLSAVLDRHDLRTLSWNMGEMVNYVELPRKLGDQEMSSLAQEVNDEIGSNTPIAVSMPAPEGVDSEKGLLRVVTIGGLDNNPCCGTHLSSVGQVKAVALLGQVKGKGSAWRLNFVAGERVHRYCHELYGMSKQLMNTLSSSFEELNIKAGQVVQQAKKAQQRERSLKKELAAMVAQDLAQQLASNANGGSKLYVVYREEGELEFISTVANGIKASLESGDKENVVLLLSGNDGAVIICGADGKRVQEVVGDVKSKMPHIRGGGKPTRFQGKLGSVVDSRSLATHYKELVSASV